MDEQAQVEIFNPLWMERREERLRSQAGEEVKGGEGSVIIKLGEGGLKGFRVIPVDDRHLGAMMILNSSLIHETVEPRMDPFATFGWSRWRMPGVWEGGEKLDASKTSLGYAKINGRSVMKTVMRNTWRWQPKGNTYRSPADPTSLVITIEEFMALTDGQAVHLSTIGYDATTVPDHFSQVQSPAPTISVGSLSSAARASAQSGVYEGAEMVARPGAALRRELERAGEVLWLGAIVDSALSMLVTLAGLPTTTILADATIAVLGTALGIDAADYVPEDGKTELWMVQATQNGRGVITTDRWLMLSITQNVVMDPRAPAWRPTLQPAE